MRVLSLVAVAAAVVALVGAAVSVSAPASPAQASKPRHGTSFLGIDHSGPRARLAWYDGLTLVQRRGPDAALGEHTGSWTFNGDRSILAIAHAELPQIRLVDVRRMRVLGDIWLMSRPAGASGLTWLSRDRLLAVAQTDGRSHVVVVDPQARRVVRRVELEGPVWGVRRLRDGIVLLLGASGTFTDARVAVADADGNVRTATVAGITIGNVFDEDDPDHLVRTILPGFAVDAEGRRAFLAAADGAVAEVDLATLAVARHSLSGRSLLDRLFAFLQPAANAKALEGPQRRAEWLGGGLLAVGGVDYTTQRDAQGRLSTRARGAGLHVVDTRDWSMRTLSRDATSFFPAGDVLVTRAWGGPDPHAQNDLIAYGVDGRERFRVPLRATAYVVAAGGYAYVCGDAFVASVLDAGTGALVRKAKPNERRRCPRLLATEASEY